VVDEIYTWRFHRVGGFDQVRIDTAEDLLRIGELDQKLWVALSCPINGIEFDRRTLEFIDSDKDGHIRPPELIAAVEWSKSRLVDHGIFSADNRDLPISAIMQDDEDGKKIYAAAVALSVELGKDESSSLTVEETSNALAVHASRNLAAWEAEGGTLKPLGDDTELAFDTMQSVSAKIDDYFLRCQLFSYQGAAAVALNPSVDDFKEISGLSLSSDSPELVKLPLANVEADGRLPLGRACNPAWAVSIDAFRRLVVVPFHGNKEYLTGNEWSEIKLAFANYAAWLARKPDDTTAQDGVSDLEKLSRYVRDLLSLANNFVAFKDFYAGKSPATFQLGTLYLDGRSCDLCVAADDVARHGVLANLSRMCLVYCMCTRGDKKLQIAAAFTAGDSDQLIAGRNGVFYDRQGQDWDATIIRILENPISLRQAFWSPYKQAARLFSEQMQKFAASKAKSSQDDMSSSVSRVSNKLEAQPTTAKTPPASTAAFDVGRFAGIFAAIGLAVGAIGTALASIVTGLFALRWWQLPIAVIGVLLVISGPSVIMAWFKLKNRNLGPVLDANGWAINARTHINIPFGTALTKISKLPEGAERSLVDPYAEKPMRWPWLVLLAAVAVGGYLAWIYLRR